MAAAGDAGMEARAELRGLGRASESRAGLSFVRARRIVYAGTALYVVVFVAAGVIAYLAYDVARLDLGDMVQAIWSTSHGHFLEVTDGSGRQVVRLGGHVDPFLALLVPLWWAWPSPLMLVVLEVVAVAAGALPVYWLARKHLSSEFAPACFAFAYLLYPATQSNAIGVGDSFHSVSIAVPLILFAIWFLDEDRLVLFAVFALLAASTKEEIAASVGCLGLWYAFRRKRWAVGLSVLGLGLTVSLINFLVIIPHFSPSGTNAFAGRYQQVGGTPKGILHTAVTDPVAIVNAVATWHKLFYVVILLAPFLGLWLLEPLLFLGAIPDLVINLLSAKPEQTQIYWQYTAGIVPFVLAASIVGASKLRRSPDRASLGVVVAVAAIAFLNPAFSPVYRVAILDLGHVLRPDPTRAAKSHALALIPPGVPISASNKLGGVLSDRRVIFTFPTRKKAEWVIVDAGDGSYTHRQRYRRNIAAISASPAWRVVYRSQGIEVLRKRERQISGG
jgi:uncharacterized membrane protein